MLTELLHAWRVPEGVCKGRGLSSLAAVQGKVWGIQSAETGELVLYPREHPPLIKVSADVAALWHEVMVRCRLLQVQNLVVPESTGWTSLLEQACLPAWALCAVMTP